MSDSRNKDLPFSLGEALAATPLTYLVPTQNLVHRVCPGDIKASVASEEGTAEFEEYATFKSMLVDEIKSNGHGPQPKLIDPRDFRHEMISTSIRFSALPEALPKEDQARSGPSLFEGLGDLASQIVGSLPLIPQSDLITGADANSTASANTSSFQNHQTNSSMTVNSLSHSTLSKPPITVTIRVPTEKRAATPPESTQDTQIKKRKSDIGIQHLQIETMAMKKLVELVETKIGLTDEQAEFESSDLWIELPNTDHILSDYVLTEMEMLLAKIAGTPLAESVKFEVLERIQHLVMKSIRHAAEEELPQTGAQPEDPLLKVSLNALKSATVLLAVFNLHRKEKKLYLDDYLTDSIAYIYTFIEDYVLKSVSADQYVVETAFSLVVKLFAQFCSYLEVNQLNDTMITKLEFMATMVFFQRVDRYFLPLKWASMDLITTIFERVPDQRSYIIEEVMTSMDKLSTHKSNSKDVKLSNGCNVQIFTILVLNLINALNLKSVQYTNELINTTAPVQDHELMERLREDTRFVEAAKQIKKDRDNICSQIASLLITRLINNSSPESKLSFGLFLQDLIALVPFPEFSAAESLLLDLTKLMLYNSESQTAIVENHLLEMIGLIGSTMLQIRGPEDPQSRSAMELVPTNAAIFKHLKSQKSHVSTRSSLDLFFAKWVDALISDSPSMDEHSPINPQALGTLNQMLVAYFSDKSPPIFQSATSSVNVNVLYKETLLHSGFMSLYHNFLNHLLQSVDHPKVKSRTKGLKNLSQIIAMDMRLIHIPQVKTCLSNRITDPSPLVRVAVLDIFDQYILQKPEFIQDFYQTILLTTDKAVSVKTKSLKIAKRIVHDSPQKEIQLVALEKILRRLEDDEESAVELAKLSLTEIFFFDTQVAMSNETKLNVELSKSLGLMVKLINKNQKNWEIFEKFLLEDIIRLTDENKKWHTTLMTLCDKMVSTLFSTVIEKMGTTEDNAVEELLGLLSIFSKSDHLFINQEQLLSLQPYLVSESSSSGTTFYSLVILRNTLEQTTSLRDQLLKDAQGVLMKQLSKFNNRELEQAMPALWKLFTMKGDTAKIANACASCLKMMQPYLNQVKLGTLTGQDPKLLRLICLTGNFGRYCDFEPTREIFLRQTQLGIKPRETVLSYLTKTLLMFTKGSVNRTVRKMAVKNIIYVATAHVKLFMLEPVLMVLDHELSGDQMDFKSMIVMGLYEFLEMEDKRNAKKTGNKKLSSGKSELDVGVFHGDSKEFENDGICASLVQRYMGYISKLCLDPDTEHSLLAVKFLQLVINLGFANPRLCTPTVVALQASNVGYIRSASLELLAELHGKHESLIDSSYISGIKEAVKYRVQLLKHNKGVCGHHEFFSKFYGVIGGSKSARKKLFSQMVRSCNFDYESIKSEDALVLMEYVLFVGRCLLEFEFVHSEDLVIVIDGFESLFEQHFTELKGHVEAMKSGVDLELKQVDRLGWLSCVVVTLGQVMNELYSMYGIPPSQDRSELKNKTLKQLRKACVELPLYRGEGAQSDVFNKLLAADKFVIQSADAMYE